ncbi:MAG: hypothetical protein MRK01_12895 [Candidatus Scalindua sp.]|nr:hypothetical protein [Candidatus Scalindua sp.]
MKICCIVYTILIVILPLIQQIISASSAPMTKRLPEENLLKEEVEMVSQMLFRNTCSPGHELPDIDTCPPWKVYGYY